jgi:hypothetical protein
MKDINATNTATIHDWISDTPLMAYEPTVLVSVPLDGTEDVIPGDAVRLPADVAKRLFSKTQPGLPAAGHEI